MKDYLVSLLVTVLVCGMLTYLSEHAKLKKELVFVAALVILYTIFAPIVSWLPQAGDFLPPATTESAKPLAPDYSYLLAESKRKVAEKIGEELQNQFGLKENEFATKIYIKSDDIENIHIERIDVLLKSETDAYLATPIRTWLTDLFECVVVVDIFGGE